VIALILAVQAREGGGAPSYPGASIGEGIGDTNGVQHVLT
jgi:hypothetical protein